MSHGSSVYNHCSQLDIFTIDMLTRMNESIIIYIFALLIS